MNTDKFKETIKKTIENGITEEFIKEADACGEFLATNGAGKKKVTTSQLRRFYGEVKRQDTLCRMKNDYNRADFLMLKPKLAYAVGRDKERRDGRVVNKSKIDVFYECLSEAIDAVHDKNTFNNFVKVFEALVAYHKKYVDE